MTQQTPQTATPQQHPDPELTGVRNFRDVGGAATEDGRRVRLGRLYRSGHLAHATGEDAVFLASLGLHTIFDFRNSSDIALEGPDVGADFWGVVRDGDLPALRRALGDGKGAARMVQAYRELILERTAEHGRLLEMLADHSVPALLHCAAGKDRAGTSIAVVLLALGVDREAIEADYMLSNDLHRRYRVQRGEHAEPAAVPEVMELLSPLFEARVEYLAAAFETIDAHWGSTERYLAEGLGLTAQRRERLRDLFLEEA